MHFQRNIYVLPVYIFSIEMVHYHTWIDHYPVIVLNFSLFYEVSVSVAREVMVSHLTYSHLTNYRSHIMGLQL